MTETERVESALEETLQGRTGSTLQGCCRLLPGCCLKCEDWTEQCLQIVPESLFNAASHPSRALYLELLEHMDCSEPRSILQGQGRFFRHFRGNPGCECDCEWASREVHRQMHRQVGLSKVEEVACVSVVSEQSLALRFVASNTCNS